MNDNNNLISTLASHQIELPEAKVKQLDQYCQLLWQWNTKLNLTRHTDYEKFVSRDLVDSLAFSEFLEPGETILDVGTGGGVPGVPLAILRPDISVSLSESVGKKARAVTDIVKQLHLRVPVHACRAESLLRKGRYTTLVIRAVARLRKMLEWFSPHFQSFDRLLILKGPSWAEERGEARHYGLMTNLALRKLASYPISGTEAESVLLQICSKSKLTDEGSCRLKNLRKKKKK